MGDEIEDIGGELWVEVLAASHDEGVERVTSVALAYFGEHREFRIAHLRAEPIILQDGTVRGFTVIAEVTTRVEF